MKKFKSEETKEKFLTWLNAFPESWHPLDYERFNEFVLALLEDDDLIDEEDIRKALVDVKGWGEHERTNDFSEEIAIRIEQLDVFYKFLKEKGKL